MKLNPSLKARMFQLYNLVPIPMLLKWFELRKGKPIHSYSNYGEDVVIQGIFKWFQQLGMEVDTRNLSYIDCGGWHPVHHSNTYWLYKLGNRGTVVEPNRNLHPFWKAVRPEDNLIDCAVSNANKAIFHQVGFAGQSSSISLDWINRTSVNEEISNTTSYRVEARTLDQIIRNHVTISRNPLPYVLSIDIEGADHQAIRDATFCEGQFRPFLVIIEDHQLAISPHSSSIFNTMKLLNFSLLGCVAKSSIYIDETSHHFKQFKHKIEADTSSL